jgi:hypothetical protein
VRVYVVLTGLQVVLLTCKSCCWICRVFLRGGFSCKDVCAFVWLADLHQRDWEACWNRCGAFVVAWMTPGATATHRAMSKYYLQGKRLAFGTPVKLSHLLSCIGSAGSAFASRRCHLTRRAPSVHTEDLGVTRSPGCLRWCNDRVSVATSQICIDGNVESTQRSQLLYKSCDMGHNSCGWYLVHMTG